MALVSHEWHWRAIMDGRRYVSIGGTHERKDSYVVVMGGECHGTSRR